MRRKYTLHRNIIYKVKDRRGNMENITKVWINKYMGPPDYPAVYEEAA